MSVIGLGVDIVRVSRISRLLAEKTASRFLARVLHPSELQVYSQLEKSRGAQYVAGSWAAKEALFKTLDPSAQQSFQFREWYRFSREKRPFIRRDGLESDDEFLLSISHDGDMLVATVLRQRLEKIG